MGGRNFLRIALKVHCRETAAANTDTIFEKYGSEWKRVMGEGDDRAKEDRISLQEGCH